MHHREAEPEAHRDTARTHTTAHFVCSDMYRRYISLVYSSRPRVALSDGSSAVWLTQRRHRQRRRERTRGKPTIFRRDAISVLLAELKLVAPPNTSVVRKSERRRPAAPSPKSRRLSTTPFAIPSSQARFTARLPSWGSRYYRSTTRRGPTHSTDACLQSYIPVCEDHRLPHDDQHRRGCPRSQEP